MPRRLFPTPQLSLGSLGNAAACVVPLDFALKHSDHQELTMI